MGTSTTTAAGTFCWHEVYSRDMARTRDFFTSVFGWTHTSRDMGESGEYTIWHNNNIQFGGGMQMDGPMWENVPPHWMSYIATDDIDAAAKKVTELGGKVCVPPTDIPDTGRFAVVSDPQGANFSLFSGPGPHEPSGAIVWNELMTSDATEALEFYKEMFGYTTEEMPMGDQGTYYILKAGDVGQGGVVEMKGPQWEGVPVHWMPYIGTEDCAKSIEAVTGAGGKIVVPLTEIPNNIGKFSIIEDPTGAPIALYQAGDCG